MNRISTALRSALGIPNAQDSIQDPTCTEPSSPLGAFWLWQFLTSEFGDHPSRCAGIRLVTFPGARAAAPPPAFLRGTTAPTALCSLGSACHPAPSAQHHLLGTPSFPGPAARATAMLPPRGGGAALAVGPSLSASAAVLLPSLLPSQRATRCQRLSGCLPGPFVPREAKCLCSGHSPESSFPPPGVYLTCPAASRLGHPSLCCCEWHCVFLVSACDPLAVDRLQLDLGEEA